MDEDEAAEAERVGPQGGPAPECERGELRRLRAEVALLRHENEELRQRAAEPVGAQTALNHLLAEAREIRGGRLPIRCASSAVPPQGTPDGAVRTAGAA